MIGMVVASVVVVIVAIGGLKIAPAYIEYFKIKKAITGIAQTNSKGTVGEVRQAFDRRAAVNQGALAHVSKPQPMDHVHQPRGKTTQPQLHKEAIERHRIRG